VRQKLLATTNRSQRRPVLVRLPKGAFKLNFGGNRRRAAVPCCIAPPDTRWCGYWRGLYSWFAWAVVAATLFGWAETAPLLAMEPELERSGRPSEISVAGGVHRAPLFILFGLRLFRDPKPTNGGVG